MKSYSVILNGGYNLITKDKEKARQRKKELQAMNKEWDVHIEEESYDWMRGTRK